MTLSARARAHARGRGFGDVLLTGAAYSKKTWRLARWAWGALSAGNHHSGIIDYIRQKRAAWARTPKARRGHRWNYYVRYQCTYLFDTYYL